MVVADNLALGKTATQSSDYNNDPSAYPAGNAVNDIIDVDDDFSHTLSNTTNQWWMVDLKKPYDVTTIEIYNRPGFCEYNHSVTWIARFSIVYLYILVSTSPISLV